MSTASVEITTVFAVLRFIFFLTTLPLECTFAGRRVWFGPFGPLLIRRPALPTTAAIACLDGFAAASQRRKVQLPSRMIGFRYPFDVLSQHTKMSTWNVSIPIICRSLSSPDQHVLCIMSQSSPILSSATKFESSLAASSIRLKRVACHVLLYEVNDQQNGGKHDS